jgi:3',5'-cyclic AMP phosphodiesterase CpdA
MIRFASLSILLLAVACRRPDARARHALADTLPVLIGAGDIADCTSSGRELTAEILDTIAGTVFVAGDAAYPRKKVPDPLHACYAQTWGRHLRRTRPAPGNHEYESGDARMYFDYFGDAAGPPNGYYSYDIGKWHVLALNTAIAVDSGSPQLLWLHSDLAANVGRCAVAYMHHPRFSSGPHNDRERLIPFWREFQQHGVSVAIAGHDHLYERFAPLDTNGQEDTLAGVRQFVVGTGGAERYTMGKLLRGSEAHSGDDFGVLKLTLLPDRYQWEFIPVNPHGLHDRGESACHVTHASS